MNTAHESIPMSIAPMRSSQARLDFDLDVDWGAINSLEGGLRYSELTYLNLAGTRYESPNLDDSSQGERDAILAINEACRTAIPGEGLSVSGK